MKAQGRNLMSIDTVDKKNEVILNRFETKLEGTAITKYSIKFKNGKSCTRVFMSEISESEAIQSITDTFGEGNIERVLRI